MFKLVVLSVLCTLAVAKPSYYHGSVEVAAPVIAQTYLAPAAVSSTYRQDVYSKSPYVAAPVFAAPIVTKTVFSPAATSYTYRADVIQKPVAVAYAAPAVHVYAAPSIQAYAAHAW